MEIRFKNTKVKIIKYSTEAVFKDAVDRFVSRYEVKRITYAIQGEYFVAFIDYTRVL